MMDEDGKQVAVAVLGLGRMGRAVAERLLDGGFDVTVWNRSPGRTDGLVDQGASVAGSVAEAVGSVQVVVTFVADDGALRDIGMRDDGVLAHLGDRWWVDMSTVSAELS